MTSTNYNSSAFDGKFAPVIYAKIIDEDVPVVAVISDITPRYYSESPKMQDYKMTAYNSWDRLQRFVMRLNDLAQLEDGWYNGEGIALDNDKIQIVIQKMGRYPAELPLPLIAPTPEGNLSFEWHIPCYPSVDIDLHEMSASFHAFGQADEDIEKDFLLNDDSDWNRFFVFLSGHIR